MQIRGEYRLLHIGQVNMQIKCTLADKPTNRKQALHVWLSLFLFWVAQREQWTRPAKGTSTCLSRWKWLLFTTFHLALTLTYQALYCLSMKTKLIIEHLLANWKTRCLYLVKLIPQKNFTISFEDVQLATSHNFIGSLMFLHAT